MKFRNQRHKELFNEAIRRLDKQNNTLMPVVYLFTADNRLWSMTRHGICYSGVDFNHIRLQNCSVGMYTLYCAAKDLYFGTDKIILSDLANPDVATPSFSYRTSPKPSDCSPSLPTAASLRHSIGWESFCIRARWCLRIWKTGAGCPQA